jgi:hypothetical protein
MAIARSRITGESIIRQSIEIEQLIPDFIIV